MILRTHRAANTACNSSLWPSAPGFYSVTNLVPLWSLSFCSLILLQLYPVGRGPSVLFGLLGPERWYFFPVFFICLSVCLPRLPLTLALLHLSVCLPRLPLTPAHASCHLSNCFFLPWLLTLQPGEAGRLFPKSPVKRQERIAFPWSDLMARLGLWHRGDSVSSRPV